MIWWRGLLKRAVAAPWEKHGAFQAAPVDEDGVRGDSAIFRRSTFS
jgi:hypothetical protein